jgi:phosphoglycerate dehydrogenase-like enzyme
MGYTMGERPTVALVMPPALVPIMFRGGAELERLRGVAEVVGPFGREDLGKLREALATARVVVTGWGSPRFDEGLLGVAGNGLGLIAHSAGSVKGIVTEAVFDRGVRVTTAAAANAVPVAQYTVAMMVALLKQVPWLTRGMAEGKWREEMAGRMEQIRELQDITVGLVAASRVGREVIKLLKAYPDVRVKLYDPCVSEEDARGMGVELVSLEEVCRCEVVSLHAPNIPETRHMMDARTLGLLPDHGVLINTSRGALIDEAALVAEVRRRPLYVMLDVTDPEPPACDAEIRKEENILLTPHIAGAMKQARCEMGSLAIDEVMRFLRGEPLQHEVTREMLPTQA